MGKQCKQWQTLFLGGSKTPADGDCSHEIQRRLLLRRKVINLDSMLKSRDISWPTKVHLVKAMVFPVVMYGCQSWTIKKAEHWRIWTSVRIRWATVGAYLLVVGKASIHPENISMKTRRNLTLFTSGMWVKSTCHSCVGRCLRIWWVEKGVGDEC